MGEIEHLWIGAEGNSVIGSCSRGGRWSGRGPGCRGEGPGATHSLCGPSEPLADGGEDTDRVIHSQLLTATRHQGYH
ncbi:Death domain-associated protein 6 [Clarias magur]|uniref:Death domain-associated protein 6 n=1 Tax=Clarias magur TaxID=1594786 RepID=A0A8J4UVN5_CLAMG|nr:Death domain-associated protein 6 [Clarias magur]